MPSPGHYSRPSKTSSLSLTPSSQLNTILNLKMPSFDKPPTPPPSEDICDRPVANLRTIQFRKLIDRDPDELDKLIAACEQVGFFYLDLVSGNVASQMLDNHEALSSIMANWFAQDLSVKMKTPTISNSHGYKPTGNHVGVGGKKDGWEALKLGRTEFDGKWAIPTVVSKNHDMFRDFQDQCHFVTKVLLDCISASLGFLGSRTLLQQHRDDSPSKTSLFFLHYPPLETGNEKGEIGQNMHTDIGSLTLLFAPQWGLQALCPTESHSLNYSGPKDSIKGFTWQWVAPKPGHAVINIGDTLRFLSGNRLRSALHRALPLSNGADRYSIAYFLRPSNDSEFVDSMGNVGTGVDWYLKKNQTYEKQSEVQDDAILLGGMREQLEQKCN